MSDAPREIWAVSGYEAEAMVADRSSSDVWPLGDHKDAASVVIVLIVFESYQGAGARVKTAGREFWTGFV